MDENRDKILNDLIKYYDGGNAEKEKKAEETKEYYGEDNSNPEENIGDTRVIPPTQPDRTIVPPPSKPDPEPEAALSGETVRIAPPAQQQDQKPSEPVEEVLGNLGLDGLPVKDSTTANVTEELPVSDSNDVTGYDDSEYYDDDEYYDDEDYDDAYYDDDEGYSESNYRRPRKGVWYALKPLWITMIISAVAVLGVQFYMTDTGVIGAYKRNFEYNMNVLLDMFGIDFDSDITAPVTGDDLADGSQSSAAEPLADEASSGVQYSNEGIDNVREEAPSQYKTAKAETVTLPFEEAGSSAFSAFDNGVVCAKSNYVCYINASGQKKWELNTSVQDPLLSTSGKYIAIASEKGNKLSLYKEDKLQYDIDIQNKIISCDVSSVGDVVLVTEKAAYKGAVTVINKRGEEIFSWSSGVNYITDASILKTRVVAVSLVNVDTEVNSYIMMFDVKSSDPFAGVELQNTLIFNVFNNGKNIYGSGDNSISAINQYGDMSYDKRFDDVYLTHTANDENGNRLLSFTQNNIPVLNMYDKRGELTSTLAIENVPDFIDIYGSTIIYNNRRDIICGKETDEIKTCYTAPMEINDLILLNSKTYMIIYANSLEIVKI